MRLAGKVAIVTGAASGIGYATAKRFAEEGARVVVADVNVREGNACASQIAAAGGQAIFVETDVGKEPDLRRMVESAFSTYGGLDILHNNAYWAEPGTAIETTIENWQHTLDVTLRAVWLASSLAVPYLRRRGRGVILNTASVHSIVGLPGHAAYQAAKGGVMSLTRALALELAPEIRVVAILPGSIDTLSVRDDPRNRIEEFLANVPMGRIGQPEEIASAAVFLASDEAGYITGTGLVVDGGYTAR